MDKMAGEQKEQKVKFYNISLKAKIKRQIKQFKLYCYTSFVSAGFMFFLLFIFTSILNIYYLISFTMSFIIGTIFGFILDKVYVFNLFNPTKLTKQYYLFFITAMGGFVMNFIFLYILVDIVGFWYLLAQLLIATASLPLLFLVHRKIVFNHI